MTTTQQQDGVVLGDTHPKTLSTILACSSSLRAFVGVGVLSLPAAIREGGITPFLLLVVFFTFVALYSILKLVECSDIIQLNEAKRNMYRRKLREYQALLLSSPKNAQLLSPSQMISPQHSTTSSMKGRNKQRNNGTTTTTTSLFKFDLNQLVENDIQLFDDYPQLLQATKSNQQATTQYDESIVNTNHYDIQPYAEITAEDWTNVAVPTFREIGMCAYSTWGAVLTDFGVLGTQLGTCIAYAIFISNSLTEVFPIFSRQVWLAIIYLPLLRLGLIKDVTKLAPIVSLGNVVYTITIIVFLYTGFTSFCCQQVDTILTSDRVNWIAPHRLATIFGTLAFALAGNSMILPIKGGMRQQDAFPKMITITMCIVGGIYFIIGLCGYFFFLDHTAPSILSNLTRGLTTSTMKLMLSACLFFSYPLQHFPNTQFYDNLIHRHFAYDPSDGPQSVSTETLDAIDWYKTVVRLLSVSVCCLVAFLFPQVHLIIALFGSLSNSLLAYILPVLFYVEICQFTYASQLAQDVNKKRKTNSNNNNNNNNNNGKNNNFYNNNSHDQTTKNRYFFPYNRHGETNQNPITIELLDAATQPVESYGKAHIHNKTQGPSSPLLINKTTIFDKPNNHTQNQVQMTPNTASRHQRNASTVILPAGAGMYGALGNGDDENDFFHLPTIDDAPNLVQNTFDCADIDDLNATDKQMSLLPAYALNLTKNRATYTTTTGPALAKAHSVATPAQTAVNTNTTTHHIACNTHGTQETDGLLTKTSTNPTSTSNFANHHQQNVQSIYKTQQSLQLDALRHDNDPRVVFKANPAVQEGLFWFKVFPYFVAGLGIVASVIGVTVAVKDLLTVFG